MPLEKPVKPPSNAPQPAPDEPAVVPLESVFTGDAPVANLDLERFKLNRQIARITFGLLITTTLTVIGLVIYLASIDVGMIHANEIEPGDRLITEKVIMAVIAATFVQVGAAAYLIVQSLFKAATAPES